MKTFAVATALAAGVLIASPAFAQSTANPGTSSGSTMSHQNTMSSSEHGSSAMNPHSLSQNQIKSVQEKLQHDGYYKEGKVDGNWGPETHQALQKFQQDHKLNANGELDQQTMAALGLQGGSWSTAGASGNGSATSSQGSMGSSSMGASSSSTAPHPASGSAGMNSSGAKTH
jgi:N-acetylmuramoyl-L-alanine amidase